MTSDQLDLFEGITHVSTKGLSLDEAFERFHEANPHIYRRLRDLAISARRAGNDRVGIKALFERLRWDYMIASRGDEFKLNNNYHSRYARLLMQREAELDGIFEVRELRS